MAKVTGLAAELLRSAPSTAARRRADGTTPLQLARALAAPRLLELLQDLSDCGGGGMRYAANYDEDGPSSRTSQPCSQHSGSAHPTALEASAVERGSAARGAGGGRCWVDRV